MRISSQSDITMLSIVNPCKYFLGHCINCDILDKHTNENGVFDLVFWKTNKITVSEINKKYFTRFSLFILLRASFRQNGLLSCWQDPTNLLSYSAKYIRLVQRTQYNSLICCPTNPFYRIIVFPHCFSPFLVRFVRREFRL
jgi:hypothetical protein